MYQHFNEAETRYNLIDPLISKAGWSLADRISVSFEFLIDGYRACPINDTTDYCFSRSNYEVLVVVEVKRTKPGKRVGKVQLYHHNANQTIF